MAKSFSILFGILIVIILIIFVYPFYNPEHRDGENHLRVSVTIYPVYDIVKNIGGDKISLNQIIPFGREPHSFEPTPKDVMKISNSQLFIYTGTHLDEWAVGLTNFSKDSDKFLKLSESVKIVNGDPHFWLSIKNMEIVAKKIAERVEKLDPKNRNYYQTNLENYLKRLEKLHNDFKSELSRCEKDSIIINHDAFKYLARDYNFKTYAVMGLSPDDKPSAKALAEIVDIVKSNSISTLFFEELASSSVMDTIAKETGVKVSSLSPLGNVPPEKVDIGYIDLMEEMLNKLKEALVCK